MKHSFVPTLLAVALAIGAGATDARADYSYVGWAETDRSWFQLPRPDPYLNCCHVIVSDGPAGSGALGTDSLHIKVNNSARTQFVTFDYAGMSLRDITSLSYQDYRYWDTAAASRRIGISIDVDYVGDGSSLTTLVFEPANQPGGANAMRYNAWQSWDAYKDGASMWWSTKSIPGVCASSCFVPWNTILAANPHAKVSVNGGFGFNVGPGWGGSFEGAADALTIRTATGTDIYDFQRMMPLSPYRSGMLMLYDDPSNPMLRNIVGVAGDPTSPSGGSFASNGAGPTELVFYAPFDHPIVLGEIKSLSYWTKKGSIHWVDPRDWMLNIYTKPYPGQVLSPPFGARITAEPYLSDRLADSANTWNQWTTAGPNNQLLFYDSTYGMGQSLKPWDQFVGDMSLAWPSGSGTPYATQPILYFSLQTDQGWAPGFTGQVDLLRIQLYDGTEAYLNLEASDRIPPTYAGSISPPANAFGWNNTSVRATLTCTDNPGGSGLGSGPSGASTLLTEEGANQAFTAGGCIDASGNVAAPGTISGINIDKTPPVFYWCVEGFYRYASGVYPVQQRVYDALSGIDEAGSTLAGTVDASVAGTRWVTFTAKDKAGNSAAQSCSYTVLTMNGSVNAVVTDLQGYLPGFSKPALDKAKSAIAHLNKSLTAKYWRDGLHLTKEGKPALDEIKAAVRDLEAIAPETWAASAPIQELLAAARTLAQVAIRESTKSAGDIQKANNEVAKGLADEAAAKFEEAAGHFKNAWDLAT